MCGLGWRHSHSRAPGCPGGIWPSDGGQGVRRGIPHNPLLLMNPGVLGASEGRTQDHPPQCANQVPGCAGAGTGRVGCPLPCTVLGRSLPWGHVIGHDIFPDRRRRAGQPGRGGVRGAQAGTGESSGSPRFCLPFCENRLQITLLWVGSVMNVGFASGWPCSQVRPAWRRILP